MAALTATEASRQLQALVPRILSSADVWVCIPRMVEWLERFALEDFTGEQRQAILLSALHAVVEQQDHLSIHEKCGLLAIIDGPGALTVRFLCDAAKGLYEVNRQSTPLATTTANPRPCCNVV